MKAYDVYKALEEMEFSEFLEPLKASLEGKLFLSDEDHIVSSWKGW